MRFLSWFFLFSCNMMWALQFTCIKLVQDQAGAMFTVWGPMVLATLMLYPIVRFEKKTGYEGVRKDRRDVLVFFGLAALGVFPGQILVTWGTRMSSATNAALLMLTLPICTAILAYIFLGEKMTPVRWVSFGLALAGVALCSGINYGSLDFGSNYLYGNVLIFIGLTGSAFLNSYSKKILRRYTPMEFIFYTYLATIVILTPLVAWTEADVFGRIVEFSSRTWLGFILLTFFHNWLSMVLFMKALKQMDATQAALSNYLITFFGLPIAAVWLGESLSPSAILGGVVVFASTLLITLYPDRRKTAASDAGSD